MEGKQLCIIYQSVVNPHSRQFSLNQVSSDDLVDSFFAM